MGAVRTLDNLAALTQGLKRRGKTIVQCHGVFDLLHPGHIRHFEAARREGDVLIVTVTPDRFVNKGPGRPVFGEQLRAVSIAALGCVDYVAINNWPTAVEAIRLLKPDVYAKGSDYADPESDLTGEIKNEQRAVKSIGGRIHFTDEIAFSSTQILNRHFNVYPEDVRVFLDDFRNRHNAEEIIVQLKGLKRLSALVVGDTIIDQYCYVETMGKSPKDNILTTRELGEESFAGGVLAVANYLAGLCGNIHLVTCLGTDDSHEKFIRKHLNPNTTTQFFFRDEPTVVKRRFVDRAFLTKMFEVARLHDGPVPESLDREVSNYLNQEASHYDLVVVADFGHGLMGEKGIDAVCNRAEFLAVMAQSNSANLGFNLITRYPRAEYICLDELELRLACHSKFGDLRETAMVIPERLRRVGLAVTLGHRGSLTYCSGKDFFEIPAFSTNVVDRMGAGDAYLSATAPCVAAGMPMDVVGFVGNAAGALKAQIVGNRPIEPKWLFKLITVLLG